MKKPEQFTYHYFPPHPCAHHFTWTAAADSARTVMSPPDDAYCNKCGVMYGFWQAKQEAAG